MQDNIPRYKSIIVFEKRQDILALNSNIAASRGIRQISSRGITASRSMSTFFELALGTGDFWPHSSVGNVVALVNVAKTRSSTLEKSI